MAMHFALASTFVFCIVLKIETLTDAADSFLTPHLRVTFAFFPTVITYGLLLAVMSSLAMINLVVVQQVLRATTVPTILLAEVM